MSDVELLRRLRALEDTLERLRKADAGAATGSFTPTLFGAGTAGTFTYDAANTEARYTRIGNIVFVQGRVIITATSVAPTGNVSIGGLPLTSAAATDSGNIAGVFHTVWSGINLQAGYTYVAGVVVGSVTSAFLYEAGDNVARVIVQGGEMGATFDIFFSGHYRVA